MLKPKATIKKLNANLNIILSKDQINQIIRGVIGPNGKGFDPVALVSDYCCVDASVGSSVAGPASSVASSVSIPGDDNLTHGGRAADLQRELQVKLDTQRGKINIELPDNIKLK